MISSKWFATLIQAVAILSLTCHAVALRSSHITLALHALVFIDQHHQNQGLIYLQTEREKEREREREREMQLFFLSLSLSSSLKISSKSMRTALLLTSFGSHQIGCKQRAKSFLFDHPKHHHLSSPMHQPVFTASLSCLLLLLLHCTLFISDQVNHSLSLYLCILVSIW